MSVLARRRIAGRSRAIGVQPGGSRRSARLASHANGGSSDEIHEREHAWRRATPATAAATRRYRFHSRLARAPPHLPPVRAAARRGRAACRCSSCGTLRRAGSPRRSRASADRRRRRRDRSRSGRRPPSPRRAGTRAAGGRARLRSTSRRGRGRREAASPSNSAVGRAERVRSSAAPRSTEQIAVTQLVDRVFEVEPAQQRIRRDFGGAQDVAPAVGFDLGERRAACARAGRSRPTPTGGAAASSGRDRRARHADDRLDFDLSISQHDGRFAVFAMTLRSRPGHAPGCRDRGRVGRRRARRVRARREPALARPPLPAVVLPAASLVRPASRRSSASDSRVVGLSARARRSAPRLARLATRRARRRALPVAVAAVLALAASELVLRDVQLRPHGVAGARRGAAASADAQLGWTFVPVATGQNRIGGRPVDYAFDAAGYRVRRVDEPVDPSPPDDPVHRRVGDVRRRPDVGRERSRRRSARCWASRARTSPSTATAPIRPICGSRRELPRFRQPVAVVSIFMTALFGRNLDDDRPHLDADLRWMPAEQIRGGLSLAELLVPYRRERTVDRGVAMTRDVLHATIDLAHPGSDAARPCAAARSRRRPRGVVAPTVLDDAQIPYVFVPIIGDWWLPADVHPNARAAVRQIADAIAARLRGR